jgi:hypothetical protein
MAFKKARWQKSLAGEHGWACLEAGAAAGGHHLDQQDDAVSVLAAGHEPLDAQHLRSMNLIFTPAHADQRAMHQPC